MKGLFSLIMRLAALAGFLIALGMVWMFGSSALRSRGFSADRKAIAASLSVGEVLSHAAHADRITVSWKRGELDGKAAPLRYPYRGGVVLRPIAKGGRPVEASECELEYRIFGFLRKFITVSFGDRERVSKVSVGTLD